MAESDEKVVEERKKRIANWLKDPYNLALALLILFVVCLRLYHFALTAGQPTWWDEGDYLALSKEFAMPAPEHPEWWGHFVGMRPLLMSVVWAVFIKFGLGEGIMRFLTEVLPSVLLVIFSYLFAKSMFNRKIGLLVGYMTAIYWVIEFYTYRFLTDIPAMLFAVASIYYFWEYYVKKEKNWGLYLCIFLGVLGFLIRFPTALVTFSVIVFLLFIKKLSFFKDKAIWIAGFVGVATLLPYFIYNKMVFGSWFPAAAFYGAENLTTYSAPAWFLFGLVYQLMGWIAFLFAALGGIYLLWRLVLGYDIVWKQKTKELNPYLLMLFWLAIEVYYFVFYFKTGNDRWILLWMPPLFVFFALGLEKIASFVKKYSKYIAIILVIAILIFAGYSQIKQSDQLIKQKLDSYKEVKDTGLWLRANTPQDAKIMCASIVQNTYYSQRRSYDFFIGNELQEELINSMVDPQGRVISKTYKTIFNETELECKMLRIRPDYLIVHIWEPDFTPQFMYDYPARHPDILTPLKVFDRNGQPFAVIYKFTGLPKINESRVNCTAVYERAEYVSGVPLKVKDPYRWAIPS